jgi:hypothetical protein
MKNIEVVRCIQILIKILVIFLVISCNNPKIYYLNGFKDDKIKIYNNGMYKVTLKNNKKDMNFYYSNPYLDRINRKIFDGFWVKRDSSYFLSSIDTNQFKIVIDTIIYYKSQNKGIIYVSDEGESFDQRFEIKLHSIKEGNIEEISKIYETVFDIYDPIYKVKDKTHKLGGLYFTSKSKNLYNSLGDPKCNIDEMKKIWINIKSDLFYLEPIFDSVKIYIKRCPCYPNSFSYFKNSKFNIVKDSLYFDTNCFNLNWRKLE